MSLIFNDDGCHCHYHLWFRILTVVFLRVLQVFTHYITARRWYAPHDLAKINDSKIERVTEMGIKKRKKIILSYFFQSLSKRRDVYWSDGRIRLSMLQWMVRSYMFRRSWWMCPQWELVQQWNLQKHGRSLWMLLQVKQTSSIDFTNL